MASGANLAPGTDLGRGTVAGGVGARLWAGCGHGVGGGPAGHHVATARDDLGPALVDQFREDTLRGGVAHAPRSHQLADGGQRRSGEVVARGDLLDDPVADQPPPCGFSRLVKALSAWQATTLPALT